MNETEIFARAIAENDVEKRSRLIDELCSGDDRLKARIESLLAAHSDPQSFFNNPIRDSQNQEALNPTVQRDVEETLHSAGSTIGNYKLLQQIGEGGMGMVFMADQTEPVKRRVALKIIKPGMDSRQVIARFEAERQALAMMDHPNIAKVLDAGTTELGHPYFVMELVNGQPITEYCDQEKLSTNDRLQLFVDVCRAVQHAHQKGIIHRDLKPSNILVAEYDGRPVPKVIDFGVAKATGSQLTDKTLFTQFGQIIGTMEYMSPEQSRRNQLDVDTRSDIYSLGIVLYKLLTGETPFGNERFRQAAWEEMLAMIRDEEPLLPSVKIGSSQSLDQLAERRSVEPAHLSSAVRGDLDWIVIKTLEKDRNRRYPSAGELADDIHRHLSQHPVLARPHSTRDRIAKFMHRNRAGIIKSAIGAALAATLVLMTANWLFQRANDKQLRTVRLEESMQVGSEALARAEASRIGDTSHWDTAIAELRRMNGVLTEGPVDEAVKKRAEELELAISTKNQKRLIAEQIEEVVIHGATDPSLESWQNMEKEMREFFREHGFDLDNENPAVIGEQIRVSPASALWSDLFELWIGTRGHMAAIGGPKLTAEIMQPWADAIYAADADPLRTGIRRFIYQRQQGQEILDQLIDGVELEAQTPRTLSWLAITYIMAGATDEADRIFEIALDQYPYDFMLAFDCGYSFAAQNRWQEAARMYHRCLAIRSDVAGIWISLANALDELGETAAAKKARAKAIELGSR